MPETIEPTRELINEIIKNEDLVRLLHLKETSWFEFREKHYATTAPEPGGSKAKYELAKDCSSIANSGGGYIFIGLKPAIHESQMTEYVDAIQGINQADINLSSWRDSLMNLLTPRFTLEDMEHGFITLNNNKTVLWLRIPSAEDKGVYPLMFHSDQIHTTAHRIKGRVIGVYERYGAENVLLSSEKLQSYISQGVAKESTGQPYIPDLSRIEAKLDKVLGEKENTDYVLDPSERLKKFHNSAAQKLGENNEPYFYFYALPKIKSSISSFWQPYDDESSIPRLMKNPPTLRRMGWDLSVAMQEYPTAEPGAWEIMNGNRKLLDVTEKGEVFAGVTIDRFLNWGMDSPNQQQHNPGYAIMINEYAFAEYIAMYFSFLQKIAERTTTTSTDLQYQVLFGFVGTEGLSVGLHEPFMMGIPSNNGTLGPMRSPSTWTIDDINPTKPYINAGFVMREIIRSGFGGTQDSPYFVEQGGHLIFDETSYSRQ